MRILIVTAAAAILFCATEMRAQGGSTTPVQTKPMTTVKPVPTSNLAEQKRAISAELKKTLGSADNLLASANKMAEGTHGERRDLILKITDGIKTVQNDLNAQLGLVSKATDKNSAEVFAKAKEVNASSIRTLERLKGELPAKEPTTTPVETKPEIPVTPK